jgi:starch phosphorylase
MRLDNAGSAPVAYFSMEVALESHIPTYAGGLGVLAGDTLRAAADMALPMIGVTLLHRKGYFFQRVDEDGRQHEEPVDWPIRDYLEPMEGKASAIIEGREVAIRAWRYRIVGATGATVPVFLLDTDVEGNDPYDRTLTDQLYGGDTRYRLNQEIILGIGGTRMLRALNFSRIHRYHMNEGHSSLLGLELFSEELRRTPDDRDAAVERTRRRCVFTTHTPVPAGHDRFPVDLVWKVLGPGPVAALRALGCCETELNMTFMALMLSYYVNGVTRRHGRVSQSMFPEYPISSITNGVHSATWTSAPFRALFDRHIPDWRKDAFSLRYALSIPWGEIAMAHLEAKRTMIEEVNDRTNAGFDQDVLTLGCARRAAAYKRQTLLLRDVEALKRVAREHGPIQILFAGKAHPKDDEGKAIIRQIVQWQHALHGEVKVAYLPNYDMAMGAMITAGVDIWVNTPRPPHEASGTSGMKAAHNGVPSLSVLDGWWLEGYIEGVTGWAVGTPDPAKVASRTDEDDARDLLAALETRVLPLYYRDTRGWSRLMRHTIALVGSFFNTQRMVQEYVQLAYRDLPPNGGAGPRDERAAEAAAGPSK